MENLSSFNQRILSELEDITAENRQARIKNIIISNLPLTPIIKKVQVPEPSTIFYSAKSSTSSSLYFTPLSGSLTPYSTETHKLKD
jgi:hypothetical protein